MLWVTNDSVTQMTQNANFHWVSSSYKRQSVKGIEFLITNNKCRVPEGINLSSPTLCVCVGVFEKETKGNGGDDHLEMFFE